MHESLKGQSPPFFAHAPRSAFCDSSPSISQKRSLYMGQGSGGPSQQHGKAGFIVPIL